MLVSINHVSIFAVHVRTFLIHIFRGRGAGRLFIVWPGSLGNLGSPIRDQTKVLSSENRVLSAGPPQNSLLCASIRFADTFPLCWRWWCSVTILSNALRPHGPQHARPPCPSPTPRACSNVCPSRRWCHPTISASVVPSSSCLQSFPASGSFPVSQLFASGGQNIGASASVLPMNTQGRSPLRLTGWISLKSKELSRVFSNTTVQTHQFFCTQLSL